MGNTNKNQSQAKAIVRLQKKSSPMSHTSYEHYNPNGMYPGTRTRLFQLGCCQTQDEMRNSCIMDDVLLQGDKIIKIAGGFTHLIILTSKFLVHG